MFTVSSINNPGLFYLISDTLYILIWPLLSCFVLIVITFSCRGPRDMQRRVILPITVLTDLVGILLDLEEQCCYYWTRYSCPLLSCVLFPVSIGRTPSQDIPSSIFLFDEILCFELPGEKLFHIPSSSPVKPHQWQQQTLYPVWF